jgi:hypothetical protein
VCIGHEIVSKGQAYRGEAGGVRAGFGGHAKNFSAGLTVELLCNLD